MSEDRVDKEIPKISRRSFVKTAGLAAGSIFMPQPFSIHSPESTASPIVFPGDLIIKKDATNPQTESVTEFGHLPEKTTDSRFWRQVETPCAPPPAYRSACCFSQERGSFILHGGYAYGANHSQTWEFKENHWQQLEEGSTLSLHGHKMVETPLGLLIYGGVILQPKGDFDISDKFYLFDNKTNHWQEIIPDCYYPQDKPALQGIGMTYHPETKSVWIFGGAFGKDVTLGNNTYCLLLPNNYYSKNWYILGRGYSNGETYRAVFEPLAYVKPEDQNIYLYGGEGYDRGDGSGIYSNELWQIHLDETNIISTLSSNPRVDYAGAVRGGYDIKRRQLVLHSGEPTFILYPPYNESVEYDEDSQMWLKIASAANPQAMGRPAAAMNSLTGEVMRFGGSYYDQNHTAQWSNQTWICSPSYKTRLPLVNR
ncbi:hypothetical protein M1563_01245 [Patescibacteria group bacterium]|nr:hypothetical protein [Patescibacteria group bacterium]